MSINILINYVVYLIFLILVCIYFSIFHPLLQIIESRNILLSSNYEDITYFSTFQIVDNGVKKDKLVFDQNVLIKHKVKSIIKFENYKIILDSYMSIDYIYYNINIINPNSLNVLGSDEILISKSIANVYKINIGDQIEFENRLYTVREFIEPSCFYDVTSLSKLNGIVIFGDDTRNHVNEDYILFGSDNFNKIDFYNKNNDNYINVLRNISLQDEIKNINLWLLKSTGLSFIWFLLYYLIRYFLMDNDYKKIHYRNNLGIDKNVIKSMRNSFIIFYAMPTLLIEIIIILVIRQVIIVFLVLFTLILLEILSLCIINQKRGKLFERY